MRTGSGSAAVRLCLAAALLGAAAPGADAAQPAAPAEASGSAQDLKAALDEVRRRLEQQRQATGTAPAGDPAGEIRAARDRVEGLARTMLDLRTERDGLRAQLLQARDELAKAQQRQAAADNERQAAVADREAKLAASRQEADGLRQSLAQGEEERRALAARADELRAHGGELEAALAKAKTDAEAVRAETERRLAGEVDTLKGRLDQAGRENAELRSVASASVQEVKGLSDQLLAALAERSRLAAATEELRSSKALQDLELAAKDEGEGTGTAAPAALGPPEQAAPAGTGEGARDKAVLGGDLFAAGGDRLGAGAAEPLARVARLIKGTRGGVRVVGHTDPGGDPERNWQLSLRRARAVRDYLVRTYGLDGGRFEVDGRGGEEPAPAVDTPAGRDADRRVEILLPR